MIRVGIECEQLEGNRFGIGETLAQFLETVSHMPDIEKRFRFVLYFKASIPADPFLHHPAFEKKVLMQDKGFFNISFNIFYHILLPLRYWTDRINVFYFPSYMLPAFFIGKAIVVLVNDVYREAHGRDVPFKHRVSYLLFCWWAARRAHIMTISEFSKKELQQFYHIPNKRIFVNPWGMERVLKIFSRDDEYRARITEIKKRYGILDKFFLSIGQAFPRRHIKEAIEAFGIIAREFPDTQYLVGCVDRYHPPVLQRLAEETNKKEGREAIVITNYFPRGDVPYLMNEMTALVYVSSFEALGIPPIEAGLCGRPAIVKDNDISSEIFGEVGYFVKDSNDPRSIAEKMERILKNKDEVVAIIKKQSTQLSRYNWQTHTERLLGIINETIGK